MNLWNNSSHNTGIHHTTAQGAALHLPPGRRPPAGAGPGNGALHANAENPALLRGGHQEVPQQDVPAEEVPQGEQAAAALV